MAKWRNKPASNYYPAVISAVDAASRRYDVLYDDGNKDQKVDEKNISMYRVGDLVEAKWHNNDNSGYYRATITSINRMKGTIRYVVTYAPGITAIDDNHIRPVFNPEKWQEGTRVRFGMIKICGREVFCATINTITVTI